MNNYHESEPELKYVLYTHFEKTFSITNNIFKTTDFK